MKRSWEETRLRPIVLPAAFQDCAPRDTLKHWTPLAPICDDENNPPPSSRQKGASSLREELLALEVQIAEQEAALELGIMSVRGVIRPPPR